jgi:hypothetical protein
MSIVKKVMSSEEIIFFINSFFDMFEQNMFEFIDTLGFSEESPLFVASVTLWMENNLNPTQAMLSFATFLDDLTLKYNVSQEDMDLVVAYIHAQFFKGSIVGPQVESVKED